MSGTLTESELSTIREHMHSHAMTLALVRSARAPRELTPLLEAAARALSIELVRTYSSPSSEFCMSELGSADRKLVMLFLAGDATELVNVSEIDEATVKDLEDSIHYSNFHSELMRLGL